MGARVRGRTAAAGFCRRGARGAPPRGMTPDGVILAGVPAPARAVGGAAGGSPVPGGVGGRKRSTSAPRAFPGDDTVRAIIESTPSTAARTWPDRPLEPLVTETDKLGDTLFLQYNLDQYEVPAAFAHTETVGYRVFEKNDSPVTQVQAARPQHDAADFPGGRARSVDISPPGTWKRHAAARAGPPPREVHHGAVLRGRCARATPRRSTRI